jgi:hypothetical protein
MSTSLSIHHVRSIRIIKDVGVATKVEIVYDELAHQSDADTYARRNVLAGEFFPWFGAVTLTHTLTLFSNDDEIINVEVTPNISVGTYVDEELLEYTE